MARRPRLPVVTIVFTVVVVITRLAQLVVPGWYDALARHPDGAAWHALTALVAYDDGWVQLLSIFLGGLVLGVVGERRFGSPLWAAILVVCGIVGQAIALAWQPEGAGSSVAVAGWLGALMAWMGWPTTAMPAPARVGPVIVLALAVWLTVRHDIHGPPLLLGCVLGGLFASLGWTRSEPQQPARNP
jgi:membrane associated rhomboid family serine protease